MRKPAPELGNLQIALQGANFKKILKSRGITKWRLAKDTGINYRTLISWQRSAVMPSEAYARRAGEYLGMVGTKNGLIMDAKKKMGELQAAIDRLKS